MALEPWDPFVEAVSLQEALSRLLQDSFVRPSVRGGPARRREDAGVGLPLESMLAVDVEELDDSYVIRASIPEVRPEDVQILTAGDTVTIRAERREEREERPDRRVILRERRIGAFARTLKLPTPVDAERAEATFENGELIVRLPKTEPTRTRRVDVQRTNGQRGQRQLDAQDTMRQATSTGGASGAPSEEDRRDQEQLAAEHSDQLPRSLHHAKWINAPDQHEDHPGQTLATRNHDVIRRWAEERQATPSTVPGSEHDGMVGVLTFDFPGYGGQNLQHISWDEWFKPFDARNLVFLFQEHLQDGRSSNFFHLVNPQRQNG